MSCPTNDTLERMALGFLEDPEPVRRHVDSCAGCAETVMSLGADHAALTAAARAVAVPKVPKPASKRRVVPVRSAASPWKVVALAASLCVAALGAFVFLSSAGESPDAVAPRLAGGYALDTTRAQKIDPYSYRNRSSSNKLGYESRDGQAVGGVDTAPRPEPTHVLPPPPTSAPVPVTKKQAPLIREPGRSPKPEPRPAPKPAMAKPVAPAPAPALPPPALEAVVKKSERPNAPAQQPSAPPEDPGVMIFRNAGINPAIDTARETKSTFALDVDTASYSMMRNYVNRGQRPPVAAVRVEEFLNYLNYQDEPPAKGNFAIRLEVGPSPFRAKRHLLRVAVLAKELNEAERKPVVLTFVIDVSGSMNQGNRLGLVRQSLHLLTEQLRKGDRIGIITYGSHARKVLDLTALDAKSAIQAAIERLHPGGSTNAESGLTMGYLMAAAGFDAKATNRVVLCSDGVANVGKVGPEEILKTVEKQAKKGITLTTLGFGMGNYNDVLLEQLADKGDGNYAYIDTYREAKKIFTRKLTGMLEVVGYDSKVQVEFDPNTVRTFRLVGYENRHVANEDFRNDKVDAGEIGSGHRVTALYELELKEGNLGRLATVRLRYREPDTNEQVEPMQSISVGQIPEDLSGTSPSYRLAASVMQFAEILRRSPLSKGVTLAAVEEVARPAVRAMDDPEDALEFLELLEKASRLQR